MPIELPAIAVIGMSCRAPGAVSYSALWSMLMDGRVSCGPWPQHRRCPSGVWAPELLDQPLRERLPAMMAGGYLDDVSSFDAALFGVSSREAAAMDPQHRLLLETAWAALQDAAINPRSLGGSSTGVYVGLSSIDYGLLAYEGSVQAGPYGAIGGSKSLGANRISHALNLAGPSLAVDAACASALVSVHLAARALGVGDCDLAIAGGANLILSPTVNVNFSKARMLSADGRCHAFGVGANGYCRSEGVGAVVLRRLEDAVAAGDPVRAVIVGSAVNQDGRTPGITVPSQAAQADVIRRGWSVAGINANDPAVIEAHGTGTPVGDPIELRALASVLGERDSSLPPCLVGSLKANIGHTEAAAGVFSVIKVVRMLETRAVPPHVVNGDLLSIPDEATGRMAFSLGRSALDVRDNAPLYGCVSAFGFGGTNCHMVLREAPAPEPASDATPRPVLITLSAGHEEGLAAMTAQWADHLESLQPPELAGAACTSNVAYSSEAHRRWIVADTPTEAATLLRRGLCTIATRADHPLAATGAKWARERGASLDSRLLSNARRIGGQPQYPFRLESFWLTHVPCPSRNDDQQSPLSNQTAVDDDWAVEVPAATLPLLREHRIAQAIVMPGAAIIDIAIHHAVSRFGNRHYVAEEVIFHRPLVLDEDLRGNVRLRFKRRQGTATSATRLAFEVYGPGAISQERPAATGSLTVGREPRS